MTKIPALKEDTGSRHSSLGGYQILTINVRIRLDTKNRIPKLIVAKIPDIGERKILFFHHRRLFLFCLGLLLFASSCTEQTVPEEKEEVMEKPVEAEDETLALVAEAEAAAQDLLKLFSNPNDTIQLDFNDPDRIAWNNLPINEYPRKGIALIDMNDEQRLAVQRMLRTCLSDVGYLQINWLLWNDERRKRDRYKQNNPTAPFYGHNNFWVTVFGHPGKDDQWGWQFEGHHLSINVTYEDGKASFTPLFLGADPSTVPDGPFAGLQLLEVPSEQSWALIESMTAEQLDKTVIAPEPYEDILTRTGEEEHTRQIAGIPFEQLNEEQKAMLNDIVEHYVNTFEPSLVKDYLDKWYNGALGTKSFAWAGSLEKGQPIYYRIHGPDFMIEYDHRSGDPNHIHSVWYDLEENFGKSL